MLMLIVPLPFCSKFAQDDFNLSVFETGIHVLAETFVVFFGIVGVFGEAVPTRFVAGSQVRNHALADRQALLEFVDVHHLL